VKKMSDNSHRYRLYEPVLFAHSNRASQGDAGCSEFHSTHGGFDGPFKVEIEARAQEGRACEDQAPLGSGQQPREEGQARRREAAWPASRKAQDREEGEEEGSAQEVGAQSGTQGKGAEHDVDRADAAAVLAAADGAEACGSADVASAAASGGAAIAAAAVDTVIRLELVLDLLGAQAVRRLVVDAAEAARQQLGWRVERWLRRRLIELLVQ